MSDLDLQKMTLGELRREEKQYALYIQRVEDQGEEHLFPDIESRRDWLKAVKGELARREE